jgi:hypothetical protein
VQVFDMVEAELKREKASFPILCTGDVACKAEEKRLDFAKLISVAAGCSLAEAQPDPACLRLTFGGPATVWSSQVRVLRVHFGASKNDGTPTIAGVNIQNMIAIFD